MPPPSPPLAGDWRRAYGYLSSLSCWGLMPQKEEVLAMLRSRVQVEGLRTYLLAHARFYTSLSLKQLCEMFELPERKVRIWLGAPRTARHLHSTALHVMPVLAAWCSPPAAASPGPCPPPLHGRCTRSCRA